MKEIYDVAIVGAGPAGSAAALNLAAAGLKTCIIDKSSFPRPKLCGSLLTQRARKAYDQAFGEDWSPVILQEAQGADYFIRHTLVHSLSGQPPLYQSDRLLLDEFLLKQAERAGAEVITGNGVKQVNVVRQRLLLEDGTRLGFRYLLGCDRANSLVARTLYGRSLPQGRAAAALEIDVPLRDTDYRAAQPQIFFGIARWGYAWIFPKGEVLTIGLGALADRNPPLKTVFAQFLKQRLGYVPAIKFQGHLIPFCAYRRHPGRDNILLCGDAAGVVDPSTGEGISFALQSGYQAARAIVANFSTPASVFRAYSADHQRVVNDLHITAQLNYLILPRLTEKLFLRVFPLSDSFARLQMQLMADQISYPEYRTAILNKLKAGLGRRLRRLIGF